MRNGGGPIAEAARPDGPEPQAEPRGPLGSDELLALVTRSLEDDKALDPSVIPLAGKTQIADWMVVATGTSSRHIAAMADKLLLRLEEAGHAAAAAEGRGDPQASWILIDAGDVIVHLFRAETRAFYDIEKLWSLVPPARAAAGG